MTILVDTNVLIDALNRRRGIPDFLFQLVEQGHILASCGITVAEVYAGMKPCEATRTEAFFKRMRYFDSSERTAVFAGYLKAAQAAKGITIGLADIMIAAVALENDLHVLTNNRKDFPMPELKILPLPSVH